MCEAHKLKELARRLRNNSTKAEIKLWNYLKRKQIMGYSFHRQKPISNYIADFYCNKLMLVIEVDGYTHRFDGKLEKDKTKLKKLNKLRLTVLRFSDEEIMSNIEGVLWRIEDFIKKQEKNIEHTP